MSTTASPGVPTEPIVTDVRPRFWWGRRRLFSVGVNSSREHISDMLLYLLPHLRWLRCGSTWSIE